MNKVYEGKLEAHYGRWDDSTKEGTIVITLKENQENFEVGVKYCKDNKILLFSNPENPDQLLRIAPLVKYLVRQRKAPSLLPQETEVQKALKARVAGKPCPAISLTPLEWDVLMNGIYFNPANKRKKPWENDKGCSIPSSKISANIQKATPKQVPSVLSSLKKKGLISCEGPEGQRICSTTEVGNLVIRREVTGA